MVTWDTLTQAHTNLFLPFLKACHYVNIQQNNFKLDKLTNFDVLLLVMGLILGQC
jgi:hypothetical protein